MNRSLSFVLLILLGWSCHSTLKIKDGQMAYEYKKYALAIDMLKEELKEAYDPQSHLLLAKAYAEINQTENALKTYGDAISPETPAQDLLSYAILLKEAERYDKAITIYQMLKTESNLDALLDNEIKACMAAQQWLLNPDTLTVMKTLTCNSKGSDYAPFYDGAFLYFTTDRTGREDGETYDWTGRAFSDLWMSNKNGTKAELMPGPFNTENNEGTLAMTSNGEELYFTRCQSEGAEDAFCRIMRCQRDGDKWSKPQVVEELVGNFNVMHPSFSMDGQLMFFSSDASNGIGGKDIYFSRRGEQGWSNPVNLGQVINTEGDEAFPHVYEDTLYFSSDGHPGMGGLDLFYTYFDEEGRWVKPINLRTPLNSGGDDFSIFIDTNKVEDEVRLQGYFASHRSGGMGEDDIYAFQVLKPVKEEPKNEIPLLLTVKAVRPIYRTEGSPSSGIRRYVPVDSALITINDTLFVTDITGTIVQTIDSNAIYQIKGKAKGLLASSAQFVTPDHLEDGVGYVRLILQPLIYNKEIVLENIYYDFDDWRIREDARPSLDSLAQLLRDNEDIAIELSSHTDCRGEDDFNLDLSQKRANSVVRYLIGNGIGAHRLTAVGYGEKRPFVDCNCVNCSEEEHQSNRRTTFKILSK